MGSVPRRSALGLALAGLAGCGSDSPRPGARRWSPADPYADGLLIDAPPPPPAPGAFTVALLPDTQFYAERHPETFAAQTAWLAAERDARRIAAVLHLGDMTNRNTPEQWRVAAAAAANLDGAIPFFPCVGNHDLGFDGKCGSRESLLDEHFPIASFRPRPSFGGVYDREPDSMRNSFHLFAAGGRECLALMLEFGPRKDVVRWANEVAAGHPRRGIILATHAFTYHDGTRYDWQTRRSVQQNNPHQYPIAAGGDVCDGQELWDGLVARHGNFLIAVNGHVPGDGVGHLTTDTPGGRPVPQAVSNFQMRPNGGDGWLRLLEFKADGRTVETYDYSPTRRQWNAGPQNRLTLAVAPVA